MECSRLRREWSVLLDSEEGVECSLGSEDAWMEWLGQ